MSRMALIRQCVVLALILALCAFVILDPGVSWIDWLLGAVIAGIVFGYYVYPGRVYRGLVRFVVLSATGSALLAIGLDVGWVAVPDDGSDGFFAVLASFASVSGGPLGWATVGLVAVLVVADGVDRWGWPSFRAPDRRIEMVPHPHFWHFAVVSRAEYAASVRGLDRDGETVPDEPDQTGDLILIGYGRFSIHNPSDSAITLRSIDLKRTSVFDKQTPSDPCTLTVIDPKTSARRPLLANESAAIPAKETHEIMVSWHQPVTWRVHLAAWVGDRTGRWLMGSWAVAFGLHLGVQNTASNRSVVVDVPLGPISDPTTPARQENTAAN